MLRMQQSVRQKSKVITSEFFIKECATLFFSVTLNKLREQRILKYLVVLRFELKLVHSLSKAHQCHLLSLRSRHAEQHLAIF